MQGPHRGEMAFMSSVVVPMEPRRRERVADRRAILGRFDPEIPRHRRGFVAARVRTMFGVVRAVMETLSYLNEPRIAPSRRLPPPR